ncbi:MAG: glycosyltransferase [Candidatus Cloacimonadales bacterium]|nr:glycosyltransferase [Candidatus Cloacimonadales bacterium]
MFVITLISFIIYAFFVLIFIKNIKVHHKVDCKHSELVSIVCSARNEENNIKNLLDALLKQDYDLKLMQVIVVDDCSTDQTIKILSEYKSLFPDFEYFTAKNREQSISPKKNALSQAMQRVKHNIVLTTDADCIPSKTWVNGMVDAFIKQPEADMVVGFSETDTTEKIIAFNKKKKSIFVNIPNHLLFEYFDFLTLMFATAASLNANLYFSCSGQNLSFKKTSFDKVGGYEPIKNYISGDDLHLMQLFNKNNMHISFANNDSARVKTRSISSFGSLFNQRARWASNMKFMLFSNTIFFIYLLSVFFVLTLIPILLFLEPKILIGLVLLKMIIDGVFVYKSSIAFKLWDRYTNNGWQAKLNFHYLFFLWLVFQPIYTIIISFMGFFSLFKWKDRKGLKI